MSTVKGNDAYPIRVMVDAGWAGWEALEEAKKEGACVPGNNMAMAAIARAVLRVCQEWDKANPQQVGQPPIEATMAELYLDCAPGSLSRDDKSAGEP